MMQKNLSLTIVKGVSSLSDDRIKAMLVKLAKVEKVGKTMYDPYPQDGNFIVGNHNGHLVICFRHNIRWGDNIL